MTIPLTDPRLLRTDAYIAGRWTGADSGGVVPVDDPATGATIATVPRCGAAETRRAVEAAVVAQEGWRRMVAKDRAVLLRRWYELLMRHQDDLGLLITSEQGKPLAEAKGEIAYAASFIEWFGEEAKRIDGEVIPTYNDDRRVLALRQPIGVTAGITPWNFPAAMIARKAGPALAAGCAMVVKPAEQTPLTALAMAALAEEAGIPPGVLSIVTGAGQDAPAIGGELTSNPAVRMLSFTGSTEIGKLLMRQCADTLTKVGLELGGNAPFLVFDDADLDAAVQGLLVAKFRNSGQTCIAANRILVQDGVYDAFVDKVRTAIAELQVGAGTEPGVQVGPLIDDDAVAKVSRHVDDAIARGGEVLLGGGAHERGGRFWQPTVITGVTTDAAMSCEETFGPVAGLTRFSTEEDAVRLANDTPYGLSAYFYSRDIGRVWRVAEGLECGMVGINTGFLSSEVAPFGGMKESGIGREGSSHGIDEYVEIKYLAMAGL